MKRTRYKKGWGWNSIYEKIRSQSLNFKPAKVLQGEQEIRVELPFAQANADAPEICGSINYELFGDGTLKVSADFNLNVSYEALRIRSAVRKRRT